MAVKGSFINYTTVIGGGGSKIVTCIIWGVRGSLCQCYITLSIDVQLPDCFKSQPVDYLFLLYILLPF